MSRLEKLIEKLCPDGVERRKLHEVANLVMGISPAGKTVSSDPNWGIEFHQGKTYFTEMVLGCSGTYTSEPIRRADAGSIIMSVRAPVGDSNIVDRKIAIGRGLCAISGKQGSHTKYLYYYLNAILLDIKRRSTGSTFESINTNEIKELPILLPPLPIQHEIVRILDHFTELTAELTSNIAEEFAARQKQYEYYRDLLLTFDDSVPRYSLGKIARYSVTRVQASEVDKHNYIGVDNLLPEKRGKTSSSHVPEQGTVIEYLKGNILIGNIRPYLKKIWLATHHGGTNGDVLVIQIKEGSTKDLTPQFLYHVLSSEAFFHFNIKHSRGAKMPRGDKRAIMNFPIPLPPLAEQERIVGILDRFDALVNDLTKGLPAEIEARRKQYEYYRDKLLTFKEATP